MAIRWLLSRKAVELSLAGSAVFRSANSSTLEWDKDPAGVHQRRWRPGLLSFCHVTTAISHACSYPRCYVPARHDVSCSLPPT